MEKNQNGEHGVITRVVGAEYFGGGYESLDDAVDAMMNDWEQLTVQERVTIAKRDYCDDNGADYMAAGFYDEETGETMEYISLREAIARIEEGDE